MTPAGFAKRKDNGSLWRLETAARRDAILEESEVTTTAPTKRPVRRMLPLILPLLVALLAQRPAVAMPDHEDLRYAWTQLASDQPLAGHSALVTPGNALVVIGGESGFGLPGRARQLDLASPEGSWTDLRGSGDLPRPRQTGRGLIGARALVDPEGDRLLLVCDCEEGQTFFLDLDSGVWSRMESERSLPLWFPALVYDAARRRAVLFGGDLYGTNTLQDAAYSLDLSQDGSDWQPLPPTPFAYLHQALAVESGSGHLVVAFGQDGMGQPVDAIWRLDLARIDEADAWQRLTPIAPEGAPGARIGASLIFDGESAAGYLFGGYVASEAGAEDLADLWRLDYDDPGRPSWERLEAEGAVPQPRAGHGAVWDARGGRMLVYGGARTAGGDASYLDEALALEIGPAIAGSRIYLPAAFNGNDDR